MPLFFLTLPLIFLTLVPGVELSPFYSMVPVTGVALLLQKLMTAGPGDRGVYFYFVPVLAPMAIYSWLALRWAIGQFQREEVLFREAERLDLGLWLRRLWREKEALPTAGEAFFCFGVLLGLRWLAFHVGTGQSLLARTGVSHLAFVATPPLLMAVMLTTRPLAGLGLRRPPAWVLGAAVALAALVFLPLAELTLAIYRQFPALGELLKENHPLTRELLSWTGGGTPDLGVRLRYLVVLGVLPAVCEELAFRGFLFTGLRRSFRPWTAILLSSFLFAVYHMNVFQMVPHFLLGIVLGLLAWKGNGVLPPMLFHLVYNVLVLSPAVLLPEAFGGVEPGGVGMLRLLLASAGAVLVLGAVALVARRRD
jgi:sodium transport system permease protein